MFVVTLALCGLAADAAPIGKIAVLPVQLDESAKGLIPELYDDVILTAVGDATPDDVIGSDDIAALIGFEKQKELLGCDDATCLANLGGALGVHRLVVIKIARVGDDWVTSCKLLNIVTAAVESRSSEFIPGDIKTLIRATPALMKRLFAGGGVAQTTPAAPVPADSPAEQTPQPPPQPVAPPAPALPSGPGSLMITTTPEGATCLIEGEEVGTTPCQLDELDPGEYRVELKREFYESHELVATIEPEKLTRLNRAMTPQAVSVRVDTQPSGALLVLDGKLFERSAKLKPGTYEISAELDDYEDLQQKLVVKSGEPLTLTLAMTPGYSGGQLRSRTVRMVFGIIFGALAAVGGGIWAWQGLAAQDARDTLLSSSPGDSSREQTAADGRTSAVVADASMTATILSVAVSAPLLISLAF